MTARLQSVRSFIAKHRRGVIGVAIALLITLLFVLYIAWSMQAWATYKTTYTTWQYDLRTDVDGTLKLPVATQEGRLQKMSELRKVAETISSAEKSLCSVHPAASWQHFISSLKTREEECKEYLQNATTFNQKLEVAIRYLENDQALAKIIASAPNSAEKIKDDAWEVQVTAWRNVGTNIEKLPVGTDFTPVKNSAKEAAKGIEAAWQGVIDAHKAKDKAKYEAAHTALTEAYNTLAAISTRGAEQFKPLAEALQAAYVQAFN